MMPRQPSRPAPTRDLSKTPGNPTHAIEQNFSQLMAIQDPEELTQAVVQLIQPLVGQGFSPNNFQKFQRNLQQSAQRGVRGIQTFLSNFMLRGSGMGVESCAIDALAGVLTEDADIFHEFTPRQEELKLMVESYGFKVMLLSV